MFNNIAIFIMGILLFSLAFIMIKMIKWMLSPYVLISKWEKYPLVGFFILLTIQFVLGGLADFYVLYHVLLGK